MIEYDWNQGPDRLEPEGGEDWLPDEEPSVEDPGRRHALGIFGKMLLAAITHGLAGFAGFKGREVVNNASKDGDWSYLNASERLEQLRIDDFTEFLQASWQYNDLFGDHPNEISKYLTDRVQNGALAFDPTLKLLSEDWYRSDSVIWQEDDTSSVEDASVDVYRALAGFRLLMEVKGVGWLQERISQLSISDYPAVDDLLYLMTTEAVAALSELDNIDLVKKVFSKEVWLDVMRRQVNGVMDYYHVWVSMDSDLLMESSGDLGPVMDESEILWLDNNLFALERFLSAEAKVELAKLRDSDALDDNPGLILRMLNREFDRKVKSSGEGDWPDEIGKLFYEMRSLTGKVISRYLNSTDSLKPWVEYSRHSLTSLERVQINMKLDICDALLGVDALHTAHRNFLYELGFGSQLDKIMERRELLETVGGKWLGSVWSGESRWDMVSVPAGKRSLLFMQNFGNPDKGVILDLPEEMSDIRVSELSLGRVGDDMIRINLRRYGLQYEIPEGGVSGLWTTGGVLDGENNIRIIPIAGIVKRDSEEIRYGTSLYEARLESLLWVGDTVYRVVGNSGINVLDPFLEVKGGPSRDWTPGLVIYPRQDRESVVIYEDGADWQKMEVVPNQDLLWGYDHGFGVIVAKGWDGKKYLVKLKERVVDGQRRLWFHPEGFDVALAYMEMQVSLRWKAVWQKEGKAVSLWADFYPLDGKDSRFIDMQIDWVYPLEE